MRKFALTLALGLGFGAMAVAPAYAQCAWGAKQTVASTDKVTPVPSEQAQAPVIKPADKG